MDLALTNISTKVHSSLHLFLILLRFWNFVIAFTADNEKGLLQISINRNSRGHSRFLWFEIVFAKVLKQSATDSPEFSWHDYFILFANWCSTKSMSRLIIFISNLSARLLIAFILMTSLAEKTVSKKLSNFIKNQNSIFIFFCESGEWMTKNYAV